MLTIPVIMYHHINHHPEDSVTLSLEKFELELKYLKEVSYNSIFISELMNYIKKGERLPKNPVALTFDDGYMDNWVYAYPLLKKYGMKATIFVITNFPKDNLPPRGNLEAEVPLHADTCRKSISAEEGLPDFLTWQEMKLMEDSGLIDIESHTHFHSRYFESDEIISFNDGSNLWLGWATEGDWRLGIPIYKNAPALVARRYFDDKALRDHLANFVKSNGGEDFFKEESWKYKLKKEVKGYGTIKGRFESEKEQEARVLDEMWRSKKIIEEKLNKKCDYICWPYGSVDKKAIERAKKVGYKGGVGMHGGANIRFTNYMNIHRFNGSQRDMPSFLQKLYKYSRFFYAIYSDNRIDNLLFNKARFKWIQ